MLKWHSRVVLGLAGALAIAAMFALHIRPGQVQRGFQRASEGAVNVPTAPPSGSSTIAQDAERATESTKSPVPSDQQQPRARQQPSASVQRENVLQAASSSMERTLAQPRAVIRAQDLVESAVQQPSIDRLALAKYALGLCLIRSFTPESSPAGKGESPSSARAGPARLQSLTFLREACEGLSSGTELESLATRLASAVRAAGLQDAPPDRWPQSLRNKVAEQPDRFALLLYASGFLHDNIDLDQVSPRIANVGSIQPVLWGALCHIGLDCRDFSLVYHELCGIYHSCDGSTTEERLHALAARYGTDQATFSSQASQVAEIIRSGRYRFLSKR